MNRKYIAFLRGINVGGTGILPMSELKATCEKLGFEQVRTYIQSGNVIFESALPENKIIQKLEAAISSKLGKNITVAVRTIDELTQILQKNPFSKEEPAKVGVMFFQLPIQKDFLSGISTSTGEEVKANEREVYIYYPNGMGQSKLKLPRQSESGTVRNINTIRKITELCKE